MIANGGGYYPSPYGSAPFPIPNNYGLTPPTIPPFYNPAYQQQQQQQKSPVQPSTPSFKLYDLATHGQSEILRLIFAYVGVSYKDKRLKKEEWEKIKTQMSFDQLPILRVNNQFKIFHLQAIIRYLAREFHLYGANKYDHAIVDIILECIRPFQDKIIEQLTNSIDQEQTFKQFITDHAEIYLKQLEKFYEIFNRHGPFYLGLHISLPDLVVYDTINYLLPFDTRLLDNYPGLKIARRRLEKHPKILDYLNRKTDNQDKISSESQRHQTKSPTPNISHHHHHRHRSHDEHHSNHRYHRHHHHHHHHHRTHSKEPTPFSQTKRSSKSPSISKKDKQSMDIIPPPPPITTTSTSEPIVD